MNKNREIYLLSVIIIIMMVTGCYPQKKITMETLLDEMVSFESPSEFPIYTTHQISSYDRRSVSPASDGWFANNDGFGIIRTDTIDERIENVLFEHLGAGAITRIWITALNKNGTIRFYFDGNKDADWTIPAYDMMKFGIPIGRGLLQPHTSYNEYGKGGSTLYLPIPYGKSCKVTFENPVGEKATPKYYHFNYREYPKGTFIETFSTDVIERVYPKIEATSDILLNPPTYKSETPLTDQRTLSENDQLSISLPSGCNAIHTIEFDINVEDSSAYAQIMRGLLLDITFDGTKTVSVPLSDFSGAGMGAFKVDSWYLYADGKGKIVSRWLMPYKQNGTLILTNYSKYKINHALVKIHTSSFEWKDHTLYFHSAWKQERNIPLTNNEEECIDWNFTTIEGKGLYVGDVLSLFNHTPSWYGEGDEKIYVDGESFPSHFGTGTEDYYNSSWAPVIPFDTPFGGAPRADLESSHGYNTFFRTRNLDAIPFKRKLRFDIEMLSWQYGSADYATTVYWYGDLNSQAVKTSGTEEFTLPLPGAPEEKEKYKVEGAIEFEDLTPIQKSTAIIADKQNMVAFTNDTWSNSIQLLCTGGEIGDSIKFRFGDLNPVKHDIVIYLTQAADYGKVQFSVNGQASPVIFDGYSTEVKNSGAVKIGTFSPEHGYFDVVIKLIGTNEKTIGNRFFIGLDCITLKEHK